jgi:methylglyoxal synthase
MILKKARANLVELGNFNKVTLSHSNLYATGEICLKIAEKAGLEIKCLKDGSQGGDTELVR